MSNPFDLGNLGGLMAGMQESMRRVQDEAAQTIVEGNAGGGLVKVRATCAQEIVSVHLAEGAMDDRELLEDLMVAATNDALNRGKEAIQQQMANMAGGLGLPPGLLGL